jgi:hypothetical protein
MQIDSLGKIAPTTPGTPVLLATQQTLVHSLRIKQVEGSTGKTYFGLVGMNKATLAGDIKQFLPAGASGFTDHHVEKSPDFTYLVDLSQFCVDADNAGEGLLVRYALV